MASVLYMDTLHPARSNAILPTVFRELIGRGWPIYLFYRGFVDGKVLFYSRLDVRGGVHYSACVDARIYLLMVLGQEDVGRKVGRKGKPSSCVFYTFSRFVFRRTLDYGSVCCARSVWLSRT